MTTRGLFRLTALVAALGTPLALNGCSFISIGAGLAAALAGGGGGGGHGETPSTVGGPPWHNLPFMGAGRAYHTATTLPQGEVLVAAGLNQGGVLSGCELYDHEQATWFPTGGMATARWHHSATVMGNGFVLAVGGLDAAQTWLTSAEIYDPLNGTWSTATAPAGAHAFHTATLLRNGRVLVTGTNGNAAAEMYDPGAAPATWVATNAMQAFRLEAAAAMLGDGRVLVCGGDPSSGTSLTSAEIYDPSTNSWSLAGSMNVARKQHTATLLQNGQVLVAGGFDTALAPSGVLHDAEIYDPTTNTWSVVPPMRGRRSSHTATLLRFGGVLVVGGGGISGDPNTPSETFCERYSPSTNTWDDYGRLGTARFEGHRTTMLLTGTPFVTGGKPFGSGGPAQYLAAAESPSMPAGSLSDTVAALSPRSAHRAVSVGALNRVLLTGGWNGTTMLATCELIDPVGGTRAATGTMNQARNRHVLIQMPTGLILAAGGWTGTAVTNASEVYNPATATWAATMAMGTARNEAVAVLLDGGGMPCVVGGDGGSGPIAAVEFYDFVMNQWMSAASMISARKFHTVTLLTTGRVFACGGWDGTNILSTTEIGQPGIGTWTAAASMPAIRDRHTATTVPSGHVLVTGGWNGTSTYASSLLYDPAFDTWRSAASMPTARRDHLAVQTLDGKVLVYGGIGSSGAVIAAPELYDPETNTWSGLASGATPVARFEHQLTVHRFGVLVSGGDDPSANPLSATQAFADPRVFALAQPSVSTVAGSSTQPVSLSYATATTVTGTGFRGLSQGAGGGTGASPGDTPTVTLTGPVGGSSGRSSSGDPQVWRFDTAGFAGGTTLTFTTPNSPSGIGGVRRGIYALRVTVNGIPSEPFWVRLP